MEKHEEFYMDILSPEDETTTLSQNIGQQSLSDLPPHPRRQLHYCKSIKAHAVTHLLQQRESEKVFKKAVL
jgi:hypothetical protein